MTAEAPTAPPTADTFRQRRLELGLTLEQLARDAGCAYSTVVRTEARQYAQRDSAARARIAARLGLAEAPASP